MPNITLKQKLQPSYYQIMLFSCIFIFLSCSNYNRNEVIPSLYLWNTNIQLEKEDLNYMEDLQIQNLYIRFFDVDWNARHNTTMPLAPVTFTITDSVSINIVPVIYITNQTFKHLPTEKIPELAKNIKSKIQYLYPGQSTSHVTEVQFDCDWSESTRENYFLFLKEFKIQSQLKLSATIRLHQVKYFKTTGVPPVDQGFLMYYNMTPRDQIADKNSIFDAEIAEKYLFKFDQYPLPLNIALPAYSQTLWFTKDGRVQILNQINVDELLAKEIIVQEKVQDQYILKQDYKIASFLLQKGDLLKHDPMEIRQIKLAANQIKPHLKSPDLKVVLFQYNQEFKDNYDQKDIENIFAGFYSY